MTVQRVMSALCWSHVRDSSRRAQRMRSVGRTGVAAMHRALLRGELAVHVGWVTRVRSCACVLRRVLQLRLRGRKAGGALDGPSYGGRRLCATLAGSGTRSTRNDSS